MALPLGRYFWKLFIANAVLMALVLTVSVRVIMSQFDTFYQHELSSHLAAHAAALRVAVRDKFDAAHIDELARVARDVVAPELEGLRVSFVLVDGTVVDGTTGKGIPETTAADRPEIQAALEKGIGESTRWSHTEYDRRKFVALRVGSHEHPLGAIRVSMPVRWIGERTAPARGLIVSIAIVSVVAAVVLALCLALLWSWRIQRITRAAYSLSRGDLSARVHVTGHDEVAMLARSLNRMRERLSSHVDTIDKQRRTLEALVSQLREGVIVADANARIVLINKEAVRMLQPEFGPSSDALVGLAVEQCVPQLQLQRMLTRHPEEEPGAEPQADLEPDSMEPEEVAPMAEARLQVESTSGVRTIFARATDIRLPEDVGRRRSDEASRLGRVLLLADVTELTRVMQVKADLAANASHELRTPLSAIRAAIETLRELEPGTDAASRLVNVVDRHSSRLEAMIGDLLELSKLESGSARFDRRTVDVQALLDEFDFVVERKVDAKGLVYTSDVDPPDLKIKVNPELLRMVLRNLIDNAIRFTDAGGSVSVTFAADEDGPVFCVADTGCGIAPEEQERIFERFYQVERARSGPDRGTGLGLSIVRHAVAAMQAKLELHSELGHGTTITLELPP